MACLDLSGTTSSGPAADPSKKIAAFAVFDGHVRCQSFSSPHLILRGYVCSCRFVLYVWLVVDFGIYRRSVGGPWCLLLISPAIQGKPPRP